MRFPELFRPAILGQVNRTWEKDGPNYVANGVPRFWDFLSSSLESGVIKAPKLVWEEVSDYGDELSNWCIQRKSNGLCVAPNKVVQDNTGIVVGHVYQKHKTRLHQANEFCKGRDIWVIAHAMECGTVVTQETSKSKESKVKMPTVCKELGVQCIDTFAMIKELGDF